MTNHLKDENPNDVHHCCESWIFGADHPQPIITEEGFLRNLSEVKFVTLGGG